MAEPALQLAQDPIKTPILEELLEKNAAEKLEDKYPWLNFEPQGEYQSLLYNPQFPIFIESLRKATEDFKRDDKKSVQLNLSLFGLSNVVGLNMFEFRRFANTFLQQLNRDHLTFLPSLPKVVDQENLFPEAPIDKPMQSEDYKAFQILEEAVKGLDSFIEQRRNIRPKREEDKPAEEKAQDKIIPFPIAESGAQETTSGVRSSRTEQTEEQSGQAEPPQPTAGPQAAKTDSKELNFLFYSRVLQQTTIVEQELKRMLGPKGTAEFEITPEIREKILETVNDYYLKHYDEVFVDGKLPITRMKQIAGKITPLLGQRYSTPLELEIEQSAKQAEPDKAVVVTDQDFQPKEPLTAPSSETPAETDTQNSYAENAQTVFKDELKEDQIKLSILAQENIDDLTQIFQNNFPNATSIEGMDLDLILPKSNLAVGANIKAQIANAINEKLQQNRAEAMAKSDMELTASQVSELKQFAQQYKNDPQGLLKKIFNDYGIDPTSSKWINFTQTADAFILAQGSAYDFQKQMNEQLKSIDPRLVDDKDLGFFIESYVGSRRAQLSEATGSNLLTLTQARRELDSNFGQQVNEFKTFIAANGDPEGLVVPFAFLKQNLDPQQTTDSHLQEQLRVADKIRTFLKEQAANDIRNMTLGQKQELGQTYGLNYEQYFSSTKVFDETQFTQDLINAQDGYQPWNEPDEASAFRNWVQNYNSPGISSSRAVNLARRAGSIAKFTTKTLLPVAGTGVVGLGAGAALAQFASNLAGAVAAGAAGGAAAGAAAGAWFFGIGALPGAVLGGLIGGFFGAVGGFLAGLSRGFSVSQPFAGATKGVATRGAADLSRLANTAGTQSSQLLTNAVGTTGGGGTTFMGSVVTPMVPVIFVPVGLALVTTFTMTQIFTAFLPDASTVQVAPYFTTDIVESPYIQVAKVPSISNSATPTSISYDITISKKDTEEAKGKTIRIDSITDTPSVQAKNDRSVQPPALPPDFVAQLDGVKGQILEDGKPITFTMALDFSSPDFQDTLAINSLKVSFVLDDKDEKESNVRAQTCIGDCPKGVVPPCWPARGYVTQLPRALSGTVNNPVLSGHCVNGGFSHCRYNAASGWLDDSYDIGAGGIDNGNPSIYAVADGIVTKAGWDTTGYGNLTAIDHGGFTAFYAHQSAQFVHVGDQVHGGQLIGKVGTTGNSTGPHLHYEIRGLSEYVLYNTLKAEYNVTTEVSPVCNEYYGNSLSATSGPQ